ncbi:bifunctional phosphopantothenoylcysteine decarboxylase/phosphopantothenate--cysteine ligase CoaBC [Bartonella sp. DGB1]|uniref:bifunctional phosphopantothenoylcysteine decarboxylase/phosphopantothenate--cysteine ligase CoaBC n=1 Tax=Bartonella sp. DGB1 TaxID=3239807 RepID=UPI0035246C92
MHNITIRRLPSHIKQQLQDHAAKNQRSMEEEARLRLAQPVNAIDIPTSNDIYQDYSHLTNKKILLIIGGGIAAYKALELIRRLRDKGCEVKVILTASAKEFVTPITVAALSQNPTYSDLFDINGAETIPHINLARWADLIIIAPATANRLAKMAHGFCDDLASSITLASKVPILLAPAMNPTMWANPATQANYNYLLAEGFYSVGPEVGEMAEQNEYGIGRMAETSNILMAAANILSPKDIKLNNEKIIVTAGATRENIDPIRYLSNRSSGLQGYSLAYSLAALGADVLLISATASVKPPANVKLIKVESAKEMQDTLTNHLPADCVIMTAAISDFYLKDPKSLKIKKENSDSFMLQLAPTPDILANLGNSPQKPPLLIGFAAETHDLLDFAQKKLLSKGADWIIANDVSTQKDGSCVMGGKNNKIHLLTKTNCETWETMDKKLVSYKLAIRIAKELIKIKNN